MNEKVKFLWLNLPQFIVYYDLPNCCNSVVAFGHKNKLLIILRPEYRDQEREIVKTVHYITMTVEPYTVRYGDSFHIDTWDNKARDFVDTIKQEQEEDEEEKFEIEYHCSDCNQTWYQTHSCACNDKCPVCNKEYTPFTCMYHYIFTS